jgi:flagellar basal body P-ring formation protein FlgA
MRLVLMHQMENTMHSPATPASRRHRRRGAGARAVRTLSALALVVGSFAVSMAHAQESGGPIVIAGPGEKNAAELQAMAERLNTPAPRAAAVPVAPVAPMAAAPASPSSRNETDRFTQAAQADGAIVIPGAGEAAAAQKIAAVPVNMPAPAPTVAPAIAAAPVNASGMMRVSLKPASREVMPVVVAPADAGARQADGVQPIAANPPLIGVTPPARAAYGRSAPNAVAPAAASTPLQAQMATQAGAGGQTAAAAGLQDSESIRRVALAYLQQQSTGLPGKIDITVATVFPRGLAACTTLEPFLPSGARLWGRTTVGVRCAGERPWTLYLQAKVSVHATYYVAARQVGPGEMLTAADLIARDGDLTLLPQAVITDPAQAVGAVAMMRVSAGLPLRRDMLKSADAVTIGQTVKVVAQGQGFAISAEGSAMNNASPGQPVRVKTANGQVIQGIVKDGGTVEIQL